MIFLVGLFSFVFAVLISIFAIHITFRIFCKFTKGSQLHQLEKGNIAVAIASTGEVIAFGILMARCLYPVSAILQNLFIFQGLSAMSILNTLALILAYFVVAYILSIVTVKLSSFLFQKLTKELAESELIMKNNIAVAILLAGIVITVAIMVQSGLADALNTLIPKLASGEIYVQ